MPHLRILHVEDSAEDALILKRNLDKFLEPLPLCINIRQVSTLKEAICLLGQEHFHAVLLDLNLPDGHGLDTLKTLKKYCCDLPVIIMTGEQNDQNALDALREGAQEYLLKDSVNGAIITQIIQSSIFRKQYEDELFHKAYYDGLTDLPNRLFFENIVETMLSHARRWGKRDALLFIDLNQFKSVNDTYGHEAGNQILRDAAKRMKNSLRTSDILARYAGDEFVVYINSSEQVPLKEEDCVTTSEKIIKNVSRPYLVQGQEITIGCSIGIALFPDHGETYEVLLKNADMAMYQAKHGSPAGIYFATEKNYIRH
ncbi:MAG: GGDEF domain-containing response regulator [Rhodospirillales bacterium]|nr:GGDEF domain-containing response regulator [Rhodospirillales bacterium]MCB9965925.1 GGDEF domain-containing response regulator [Rhodospirillales bacterium]